MKKKEYKRTSLQLNYKVFAITTLFLIALKSSYGQIKINELCPANVSIIQNSNGNYDDWMELYNAGSTSIDLSGYGITDDTTKKYKFSFPTCIIEPDAKMLVFASGHTNRLLTDHWEMAAYAGSLWKYTQGNAGLDTNWRNLSFNESAWSGGYAGIGFGDGDDNTTVPICVSVMMRKTFNISDTSKVIKAAFLMDYDDGFVAYLNGVEIARSNLGTAGFRPAWNDLASSGREALGIRGLPLDSFYIDPVLLKSAIRPGTNVLAIEVHNSPANSDDLSSIPYLFFGINSPGMYFNALPSWFIPPGKDYFNANFKMSHNGETVYIYSPLGAVVDQKTYPIIEADNTYCRIPDGSSNWCYSNTPTPGTTNNATSCFQGYAPNPIFSKQGGYYSSTQSITLLTSAPGGEIRYTTNGNTPTATSTKYTSPIVVSSTKSIRARVFAAGYLPSQTVTNTFIINGSTHLSTFSITTDSLNLWDYNTGIYVMGPNAAPTDPYKGANFWQDWEKPASIEYYDKNKNLVVRFDADIKIYGNYSKAKPQKSFEIKLRSHYGTGSFTYPLYPDKSYVTDISDIVLRNSGTDWNKVHFRDAMMERIMKNTNTGYLATEPAIAYLNGAYWGVYHINENHSSNWMKDNFGYDKSEIDYLKEWGTTVEIQTGSDASFWEMYNYITTQTPTTQQYYDYVNTKLDLKNYTDYFAAETFYNNGDWIGDWTNNIQLWRPKKSDGKWRYFLYDLDYGLGLKGLVTDNRLAIARNPTAFSYSSEMFDAILKNPTYKKYFINRYADLMNTIFLPSNVSQVMHSYKDSMAFDMTAHFAKWGSNTSTWNTEINDMLTFESSRISNMKNYIKSEFAMNKIVTLTLKVSPNNAGRIEISTVTPTSYPWTGDYFDGNPVTITAIPNPGYTFNYFKSSKVITSNNYNQSITTNFNQNDQITAYFTGSAVTPSICVSELNYNADSTFNSGDWIELHNFGTTALDISGWSLSDGQDNHKFDFPTGTSIAANGYLVVVEDSNKFKSKFPSVTNWIGLTGFNFSNGGDQIRLFNYTKALYLSFYYQDIAPWTTLPDGQGYTLELTSNTANPNNPASWFAGCIGGSPGRAYSTSMLVPVAVTGSTTFCSGSSTTLKATPIPGSTYQWKKNGTTINGSVDSIYQATIDGSYAVNITTHGCSALSPVVAVAMVSQQPMPVTTSASRCGSGGLMLSATSSDSVFWFDSSIGGSQVAAGNTLSIPYLNQSKTYFARTGRNCPSNSVATLAEIIPPAASPVAADASRCGPGIVTLNATDTAEIRWYNASSGGGLLATGNSFSTNTISKDTSFFIEAGSVCPSPRLEVQVKINSSQDPITSDASRCGFGSLALSATSSAPVFWYDAASGGNLVGSGNNFTTPYLVETDTFYAEANNGCPSARMMSMAIVNPIPADPVLHDTVLCSPGTATLFADASEQVNWFTSPTGGQAIYTGTIFNTPVLSTTTMYYASSGYSCQSNRLPVKVTLSSPAAPPVVSNANLCDSGSVTLTASSPETIYWYDAPSGGNLLLTGNTFTTPNLTSSTSYYTEAGTYCRGQRVPVSVNVNPTPAAPVLSDVSKCGPGTFTFSTSSNGQVNWFNVPSGGNYISSGTSYTTPVIATTATFYAEANNGYCISKRNPVQAVVNPVPPAPTASGNSNCGPGSVNLNAMGSGTISWFPSVSGGIALSNGSSFTTPTLNTTTVYYAESTNGICKSPRTSAAATIIPIPAAPVTSDVSRCNTGSVTLTASSPEQLFWYDAASGGTLLCTGSSFSTPVLTNNTTYFVQTGNLCLSQRIPVMAQITSPPPPPVVYDTTICGLGVAQIRSNSLAQVNWYTTQSGGTILASGQTFTTPPLTSQTTFYADAGNGCNSNRVPVNVSILPVPAPPTFADSTRCGQGTLTLYASSTEQVYWFSSNSSSTVLATGNTYTTPNIVNTTTYYLETGNACRSARLPLRAIIKSNEITTVNSGFHCGTGSVLLTATSTMPADSIKWYSQTGGNVIATGASYTTPVLSQNTTYFVAANSECMLTPELSYAIIYPVPVLPVWPNTLTISSGQVITLDAGSGNWNYLWSTGETTAQIQVAAPGNYSVVVTNNYGCSESQSVLVNMSTSVNSIEDVKGINIYPNPATDKIKLEITDLKTNKIIVKVLSVDGKVLFREEEYLMSSEFTKTIQLAGMASGFYFLEITSDQYSKTVKFLKE